MTKTIEQNFADWEGYTFGFGYGTGEPYTLAALKTFMANVGRDDMAHAYDYERLVGRDDMAHAYDYERLERALTPTVAWLLINRLCAYGIDVIEYGTSPRFGWLTEEGIALKQFIDCKTVDELVDICCSRTEDDDIGPCYPDTCNCGPRGYQAGVKCPNPFWKGHH